MAIEGRYAGNREAFTEEELAAIRQKRVCVLGCGGLGGFVCNALARFGVGALTVVDGDTFSPGNLNRQLYAAESTLGRPKAQVCAEALAAVNSEVAVTPVCEMLTEANAAALLAGHHLVLDCLDNGAARLLAARSCAALGIPLVHGALGGFYGQVANVFPGDGLMDALYAGREKEKGIEKRFGNPVFTAQAVSAIQCAEALKLLAGRADVLRGELLHIDLLAGGFERVAIL